MSFLGLTLLSLAAATPIEVSVKPSRGAAVVGALVELSEERVVLQMANGQQVYPASALQVVQTRASAGSSVQPPEGPIAVTLVDGSALAATSYGVRQGQATVRLAGGSDVVIPTRAIRSVSFSKQDAAVRRQWQEILAGRSSADVLVVRKVTGGGPDGGEPAAVALDHLEGVLSDMDQEAASFEFDGTRVAVPRRKVEGVIYFHPPAGSSPEPVCRVFDSCGSSWCVRSVRLRDGDFELASAAGVRVVLPGSRWTKADYSAGNTVFLTDLEPESVQWRPFLESAATPPSLAKWFQPRWENGSGGAPLMLGGQSYERGLGLHSRTLISFRLAADFQRFLATVGVDDRYRPGGNVRLVVSGEKGPLLERTISGKDEPFDLDVDIHGIRRLQILVDFGDDRSDTGDHLNLCDARLTK